MTVHAFADFVPTDYYEASGFDNTSMYSQNCLPAEHSGVIIYREGRYIHGNSSEFTTDLTDAISDYRTANGAGDETIFDGRVDRRITFDSDGDCYTLVTVGSGTTPEQFYLHSEDGGVTWTAYLLPGTMRYAKLEFNATATVIGVPPSVVLFNDSGLLQLVTPSKSLGVITIPSAIQITASDSLMLPQHSGGGNVVCSYSTTDIFVAWPSKTPPVSGTGTVQYLTRVDRSGQTVTSTTSMGQSNSTKIVDDHDCPAILVDSTGVVHFILGAHHGDIKYGYSSTPWTTMSTLETVASKHPTGGGHTYMALVADSSDDLYLVTRNADGSYDFKISFYKQTSGTWAFVEHLVLPGRIFYGIYYHSLSIYTDDTLVFTSPGLLAAQISASEYTIYNGYWPGELTNTPDSSGKIQFQSTQKPHFPMVFVSDDNGDTWTKTSLVNETITEDESAYPYLALRSRYTPVDTWRCDNAATGLTSASGTEDTGIFGTGHNYQQSGIVGHLGSLNKSVQNGTTSGSGFHDSSAGVITRASTVRSIEMWFRPTIGFSSSGGLDHYLFQRTSATAGYGKMAATIEYVTAAAGKIQVAWNDGATGHRSAITNTALIAPGSVYHLVGTYVTGATAPLIYVNGVLQASTSGTVDSGGTALDRLTIGCSTAGVRAVVKGFFDEVSVYNYALTAEQVLALYRGYFIDTPEIIRGRNLWTGKRLWNRRA